MWHGVLKTSFVVGDALHSAAAISHSCTVPINCSVKFNTKKKKHIPKWIYSFTLQGSFFRMMHWGLGIIQSGETRKGWQSITSTHRKPLIFILITLGNLECFPLLHNLVCEAWENLSHSKGSSLYTWHCCCLYNLDFTL